MLHTNQILIIKATINIKASWKYVFYFDIIKYNNYQYKVPFRVFALLNEKDVC